MIDEPTTDQEDAASPDPSQGIEPQDAPVRERARRTSGFYGPLEDFVRTRVESLQRDYLDQNRRGARASASASLARLRRATTSEPGSDPTVWQETLAGMPEQYIGADTEASPAESAAHTAITLFAMHQQSKGEPMHRRGVSFGTAVARLAVAGSAPGASGQREKNPAVVRRFHAFGTATSLAGTAHHGRGLISQFRAAGIPLDYGRFAVDLARLQSPAGANGVRLDWGRAFHFVKPAADAGDADAATAQGGRGATPPANTVDAAASATTIIS